MNYIILSAIIFCIGVFGVLIRRNLIVVLMSVELMISAVNIAFIAFSRAQGNLIGHVAVLLVFVVAACEAAVGLAIIVMLYRQRGTIDISDWKGLKG